jgi:hypothetical protein
MVDYKEIPLNDTKGVVGYVKVSPEDYDWLMKYSWHKRPTRKLFYAHTTPNELNDTGVKVKKHYDMHVLVKEKASGHKTPDGYIVDHIDRDTCNNTRENLRYLTQSENLSNAVIGTARKTSQYKGVQAKDGKWQAKSTTSKSLGVFENEKDAATAFDMWVLLSGSKSPTNNLIKKEDIPPEITADSLLKTKIKKNPDLPSGITKLSTGLYRVDKVVNGERRQVSFQALEDALQRLNIYEQNIKDFNEEQKRLHFLKPIIYNGKHEAVIQVTNKKDEIFELIVDEDKWHELSQYAIHRAADGDFMTSINAKAVRIANYILPPANDGDVITIKNGNKNDMRRDNLISTTMSVVNHRKGYNTKTRSTISSATPLDEVVSTPSESTNHYVGVYKKSGSWTSMVSYNGQCHYAGSFDSDAKAALAYNIKIKELYGDIGKLNILPREFVEENTDIVMEQMRKVKEGYHGISYHKSNKKWRAAMSKDGVAWEKSFDTPEQAAYAYNLKIMENYTQDEIASSKRIRLNVFPQEVIDILKQSVNLDPVKYSSKYKGVSKKGGIWQVNYKNKYYKSYKTEEDAARGYNEIVLLNNSNTPKEELNEL